MTEVYLRESLSKLNIKNKNPYRNCPEKDEQIDKNKNEKKNSRKNLSRQQRFDFD